jgi:hypothetical protein
MTPNIHTIIRQHVSLEVRCIDRVYLHAYMPKLQTSGGLCYFLHDYLVHPVPSPALLKPRHDRLIAGRSSGEGQPRSSSGARPASSSITQVSATSAGILAKDRSQTGHTLARVSSPIA